MISIYNNNFSYFSDNNYGVFFHDKQNNEVYNVAYSPFNKTLQLSIKAPKESLNEVLPTTQINDKSSNTTQINDKSSNTTQINDKPITTTQINDKSSNTTQINDKPITTTQINDKLENSIVAFLWKIIPLGNRGKFKLIKRPMVEYQANQWLKKHENGYKTELCTNHFYSSAGCHHKDCTFIHSLSEVQIMRHPAYKTELCLSYQKTKTCPYGSRCNYIHEINCHIFFDKPFTIYQYLSNYYKF
jgi:hypothetical protein